MTWPPPLMPHQVEGVKFLRANPRALIADEPGIGKSVQALLAAVEPVLIVAPAMVLDSGTWDDEIAKWRPGLNATQVSYSSLNVREKTAAGGSSPTTRLKDEYARHWGTVICDESHTLKSRKAKWTHAARSLDADRMILLTGTPIPNWGSEAFTTCQLLFPEEARPGGRFGSYWRWVAQYFEVGEKTDKAGRVLAKMAVGDFRSDRTWEQFREECWGGLMLLRRRDDVLRDLPPLTITPWYCTMRGEQARVYRALEKDFVAWLDSGQEVVAWNQAAQIIKLAKCGFGLESLAPGEAKGSAKLAALQSILQDRPRPTLVVGHFRSSVDACAQSAVEVGCSTRVVDGGTSKADRLRFVREFQSGDLQVLCATIDTIGEGLTLHQGGADQVIRAERSYRPSRNEQVVRRLHRMGVERPVQVIDLITRDSMDQRILALLEAKTDEIVLALGTQDLRALAS